jgi:DNA helicase-2/ATP-dependent DNA helicase PcrA
MRPEIYLGPPGCGKTTTLLNILDVEMASGVSPGSIGFVSFTTKAAREAVERACSRFGKERGEFTYFRTLHSLCFRTLGLSSSDVLAGKKFSEFADWCGIRVTGRAWSDDGLLEGFETGDRILFMENLARIRRVPLREQYDLDDDGLDWREVDRVSRALAEYKARHALLDYTDFLTEFVRQDIRVSLDVLLGDETQDFSALQWAVFWRLARGARRVCVAGDDDQAIYRWAGADVEHLIDLHGDVTVLGQSWRCPPTIQLLSGEIIGGVSHRREKAWRARDGEAGGLRRVASFGDADVNDSWAADDAAHERPPVLVLARNVYVLRRDVEPVLRSEGVVFETSTGKSSLDLSALQAAETWTRLGRDEQVRLDEARKMYEYLHANTGVKRGNKKLPSFGDEGDTLVSAHELITFGGLLRPLSMPWHEALDRISVEDVAYMRAARRRGERLRSRPRIRISTIHSAKGGEADHVVLMTEMARRTHDEMERNPDDERRVWYVGVTRTRQHITVVNSREGRYCPWI